MRTHASAFGVAEARRYLGNISVAKFYELVNSGELRTFKVGRRRLISAGAIEEFINRREKAQT